MTQKIASLYRLELPFLGLIAFRYQESIDFKGRIRKTVPYKPMEKKSGWVVVFHCGWVVECEISMNMHHYLRTFL